MNQPLIYPQPIMPQQKKSSTKWIWIIIGIILLLVIIGIVGYVIYTNYTNNTYVIHYSQAISEDGYSPDKTSDTISGAQQLCGTLSDCYGFIWDVTGRKAYLRKGLDGVEPNSSYDTYIKNLYNSKYPIVPTT